MSRRQPSAVAYHLIGRPQCRPLARVGVGRRGMDIAQLLVLGVKALVLSVQLVDRREQLARLHQALLLVRLHFPHGADKPTAPGTLALLARSAWRGTSGAVAQVLRQAAARHLVAAPRVWAADGDGGAVAGQMRCHVTTPARPPAAVAAELADSLDVADESLSEAVAVRLRHRGPAFWALRLLRQPTLQAGSAEDVAAVGPDGVAEDVQADGADQVGIRLSGLLAHGR